MVREPTSDGGATSLEIFDGMREAIAILFGKGKLAPRARRLAPVAEAPFLRSMKRLSCFAALLASGTALAWPQRVVSVGGAVTEAVYALGVGERLVAADSTSTWPEPAARLPRVGYMRTLSAEGVLSMRPDLVLASGDAGPQSALKQIQGAGVAVTVLDDGHSFQSLRANLRIIAAALDLGSEGEVLGSRLDDDWAKTLAAVRAYRTQPRVAFILAHAGTGMLVAGEGTAAGTMIRLAGATNALTGFKGYKPLTAEAIIGAQPEVLLITEQGLAAVGGAERLWQAPGLGLTPAAAARNIVAMDALYLLGFGPRLPQAVRELAERLRGSELYRDALQMAWGGWKR